MKFRFTSLKRRVKVYVGQHFGGNDPRSEAVLRVFDSKNALLEKKYVSIGAGPRRITLPLEIDVGANKIYRAEVQFLLQEMLDDVYFEVDSRGVEIIDNLIFEGDDPPPPPPDDPPLVRITTPASGQVFFGDPHIRLEGTVAEDHGLGRLTLTQVYLDKDPDPAPVPIDWDGTAPNYTFPLFPNIFRVNLATGRNRLTVEALDSRNQAHSAAVEVTLAPAPAVSIDSPADEATVDTEEIQVSGRIQKPYGVLFRAQVTIEVEGSGVDPAAVDVLQGSAAGGYTFRSRVTLNDRFPLVRRRIIVAVVDEGGSVGRAFADVNVRRPNRIAAERIEVTQAVLSATLVVGRRTIARVYADAPAGAPPGVLANIRAELHGYRSGVELPSSPLSPQGPDELDIDPADSLADRQNDQAKSWNFVLPASWRNAAGDIDLTAAVDPANTLGECDTCEEDNRLERSITFVEGETLRLRPIKVSYLDDGTRRRPSDAEITASLEGILRSYPYGSIDLFPTQTHDSDVDLGDDITEGSEDILEEIYDTFTCYDSDLADIDDWDEIFGWLVDNVFGCSWSTFRIGFLDTLGGTCPGGLAFLDSPACVSEVNPWVAAQELAHCFDLDHAGNSHGEDAGGGFDEDFPYPHGGTGEIGFDTAAMVAIPTAEPYPAGSPDLWDSCRRCDPASEACHTHDFMSYGDGPNWISDYTWENLFRNGFTGGSIGIFGGGEAVPQGGVDGTGSGGAATLVLHLSGRVHEDGSVSFRHFYSATPPAKFQLPPGAGPFEARSLDAAGNILASHRFDSARSTHGRGLGSISTLLPFPSGTQRVEISKDGVPVAARRVSAHPPQVTVLHPNGGERFGAGEFVKIWWEAGDVDGDALRYGVQYSSDDGQTWHTVGFDLQQSELEFRAAEFPGGSACRIRVMATDGLLAARDVSDGSFAVAGKPPYPVILYPKDGAVMDPQDTLVFEGTASDLEDGALSARSLTWRSDRDGALGSGRSIDVKKLSLGQHRITLTARDRSGAQAAAEVTIQVGQGSIGKKFIRGNLNGEGGADITDSINLLEFLFLGKQSPTCEDAADVNDDGKMDITDAINLLEFLFLGGEPPQPPFPEAGIDPTTDSLGC